MQEVQYEENSTHKIRSIAWWIYGKQLKNIKIHVSIHKQVIHLWDISHKLTTLQASLDNIATPILS